jgi:hypothetical protein
MFLARYAYYGDWLPNTYYLKATGWPVSKRLVYGIDQNVLAIIAALIGLVPVVALLARGPRRDWIALSCLFTHVLVLTYSTCLGGDFSFESFGYDRFTSVGALFLLFGLCCALLALPLSRVALPIFVVWAAATVALPVVFRPHPIAASVATPSSFLRVRDFAWRALLRPSEAIHPIDNFAQLFVYYGKKTRQLTLPGALVALCPAGAAIYYSHRGGVDLLGKVDPLIARLDATAVRPKESRCWQGHVGHNKEDLGLSFRTHKPDLSLVAPPEEAAADYIKFQFGYLDWWARRGSPYVRWPVTKQVDP